MSRWEDGRMRRLGVGNREMRGGRWEMSEWRNGWMGKSFKFQVKNEKWKMLNFECL